MSEDGPDESVVERQFEQAQQALDDAEGARRADLSDAVVVNRSYYACFHAAQGTLTDRGVETNSHGGVLSSFGSEVVVPGDAQPEHGRFLNRLSELRAQADYGHEVFDSE
ncbi:MAG: HEPN domain-containing protein [Halobaculum sp.]